MNPEMNPDIPDFDLGVHSVEGVPRQLKATWSMEDALDLRASFYPDICGIPYRWVSRVRWYQFWRWHVVLTADYHMSRVADAVIAKRCADDIKSQMDRFSTHEPN